MLWRANQPVMTSAVGGYAFGDSAPAARRLALLAGPSRPWPAATTGPPAGPAGGQVQGTIAWELRQLAFRRT